MFLKRDYLEIFFRDRARAGEGSWKLWRYDKTFEII